MGESLDLAWTFLKSIDFSDVGPMPTRLIGHPSFVPYDGHSLMEDARNEEEMKSLYEQFPDLYESLMEESYIPDMQRMLELAALKEASGQQVPRNLLQAKHVPDDEDFWEEGGATSPTGIYNRPQGGTPNLPLPD